MTSSGSARDMLVNVAGAKEVPVSTGDSTTSALVAGSGPPLLLLHGFNAAASLVWWPVIPALSESFRVVAPDLPGLGESESLPGRPSIPHVVQWLAGVIEEYCDEPATLVATSLSGGFGLRFAAVHSDRLRDLILTDAQGLAPFRPPPGFLIATTFNRLRPGPASARRLARYVIHDQESVRQLHGSLWDTFIGYMVSQTGRGEVKQAMSGYATRATARPIPTSMLEDIELPVGLVWGLHDRPFPISIAEKASSRFGWPLEVIEDAGHLPYLEAPSRFVHSVNALTTQSWHCGIPRPPSSGRCLSEVAPHSWHQ